MKTIIKNYILPMLPLSIKRLLVIKPDRIQVTRSHFDYMSSASELMLIELYGKALQKILDKKKLLITICGQDIRLFGMYEALWDFGFTVTGFLGNWSGDTWRTPKPYSTLSTCTTDLFVIGGDHPRTEDKEFKIFIQELRNSAKPNPPVFRYMMLRHALAKTLNCVKSAHFFSCLNPRKLMVVSLAVSFSPPRGLILECGAYRCGTTVFMGLLTKWLDDTRNLHAIDTFEGMPDPTAPDGETVYKTGMFSDTNLKAANQAIQAHDLSSRVKLHKGLVGSELPKILFKNSDKVSLALVDTDQYQGTIDSLKLIIPKLLPSALILVDDYSVTGVRSAIDEVQDHWPTMRGFEWTHNLYVMWNSEYQDNPFSHLYSVE